MTVFCRLLDRQPNESAFLPGDQPENVISSTKGAGTLICRIIKELHCTLEGNILLLRRSSLKHTRRYPTATTRRFNGNVAKKEKLVAFWKDWSPTPGPPVDLRSRAVSRTQAAGPRNEFAERNAVFHLLKQCSDTGARLSLLISRQKWPRVVNHVWIQWAFLFYE